MNSYFYSDVFEKFHLSDGLGCQMSGSGFEIFFRFGSGQVLKYFFGFGSGSGLT